MTIIRDQPSEPIGTKLIEDSKYPKMYRIQYADGTISDMLNLTRAKDLLRKELENDTTRDNI